MMNLSAKDLCFGYSGKAEVFDGLNIPSVEFQRLALIGRSGSGKSTMLRMLGRALVPQSGIVSVNGPEKSQLHFGYVHQEFSILPWLSVARNSALGGHFRSGKVDSPANQTERARLAALFGLDEAWDRLPKTLSGGMKQRLALVNALTSNSDLLLLDEAFSASDGRYRDAIFAELKAFAADDIGRGIIFISHEIADVVELSDAALCLPSRTGGQPHVVDARNGWTKTDRKRLAELMLGEAL